MTSTLPSDIVCLMGTITHQDAPNRPGHHRVYSYTRTQMADLDCHLCGMRADWIIFLETPSQDDYQKIYLPFLCALTAADISRMERGEPRQMYPVIYDKDMKRLYPKELP